MRPLNGTRFVGRSTRRIGQEPNHLTERTAAPITTAQFGFSLPRPARIPPRTGERAVGQQETHAERPDQAPRRFRLWLPEPGLWFQWDYADGPPIDGRKTWFWWLGWREVDFGWCCQSAIRPSRGSSRDTSVQHRRVRSCAHRAQGGPGQPPSQHLRVPCPGNTIRREVLLCRTVRDRRLARAADAQLERDFLRFPRARTPCRPPGMRHGAVGRSGGVPHV